MLRVYSFVDGGHIRSGLDAIGADWRNVNLREASAASLRFIHDRWQGQDMGLSRVFLYDAVPDDADPQAHEVENWLSRNDALMDVHVRRGHLVLDKRKGPRRQKGVDVQLAVDALTFASNGTFDVGVFVAGDADFAPLLHAVRDKGPLVAVCSFESSLAESLREAADRVGYLPSDPVAWQGWKLPRVSP